MKSDSIWIDLGELGKGPAAILPEVVHTGNPVGVHGGFLFLGVFAPIALDLDDQVQGVVLAVAIIHQDDEVGHVCARFRAVAVGHFQAEVVVLDVGTNPGMGFGHAAEFGLPVAVEDHPVDVTTARIRLPAVGFGSIEVHVHGGADGIVRVKHGLDGPLALSVRG